MTDKQKGNLFGFLSGISLLAALYVLIVSIFFVLIKSTVKEIFTSEPGPPVLDYLLDFALSFLLIALNLYFRDKVDKILRKEELYEESLKDESRKEKRRKQSTGRQPGWHWMKEFVDKDGNVYHKGVEVPELKGTLPPTKPKKIKPRSKRENKLIIGGKNITAERLKCALGSCYLKLMQDLLVQSGGWIVTDGFINKDFIIKSEAFSDLELKTKSELRNTAKTLGLIELANDYKTLKIQKERIVQILDSYKTKSFKKVPDPKSYSYNFYFLTYLGRVGQLRRGNDFPLIGNTVSIKNAKSAIATLHPIEIFGYRFLLEAILEQIIMDGVDGMGRIDGF